MVKLIDKVSVTTVKGEKRKENVQEENKEVLDDNQEDISNVVKDKEKKANRKTDSKKVVDQK